MSSQLATLGYKVDSSGLLTADKRLQSMTQSGAVAEGRVSRLGGAFTSLKGAIGLAAIAMTAIGAGSKLLSVSREFDILNAQLITATGSAKNASVAFDAIQSFAAQTPFDLAQVTSAFTKLVNLGLDPSEASLTSFGNTASAMGKDLSQVIEAVADAATGEFERLKEFGIKSKQQGDLVSFTFQGVTTTVQKSSEDITKYLTAIGNNQFAGAMEARAKTLDGAISNLGDSWNSMFLTISKQGFSESIARGVAIASEAITYFDYLIGSGSLAAKISAIGDYFSLMASDVEQSFHLISAVIGDDINVLGNDFKNAASSFGDGLLNFPQMLRFAVASSTVYLASLVDEAKVYGDLFVETLSLSFQKMVDKAKVYGKAIGNAMNPFSDGYDFQGEMITLEQGYAHLEKTATDAAQGRYDTIAEIRTGMINGFALEGSAATELFQQQMKQSDLLLDQRRKEREAEKAAVLGQFKLNAPGKQSGSVDSAASKSAKKQALDYNSTISALELLSAQQRLTADQYEIHVARMKATDQKLSSTQKTEIENRILAIQKERAAISEATNYSDWLMSVNEAVGQASALEQEILKIQKAMAKNNLNPDVGKKRIEQLKEQMEDLKDVAANPFDQMIAGANDAASAMSGMFEAGSKDAQKMAVAMAALNLIAGVGAILTQGKGDPYSAFGRMAAMAAMVASLGVAVGGLGGSFDDTAKANQEAQGLNVWGEKSESISRATDITASATEKIVGINTRMLSALQSMQAGISNAAGMIANGAGGVSAAVIGDPVNSIIDNLINGPMSTITSFMKKFTGDFLGIGEMVMGWAGSLLSSTIGKWLGGSSKVTDSGIKILGGTISEIISGASVFAYQETQYKSWGLGKKKKRTDYAEMDDASAQVALIFDSLATSVYEGGVALGMSGAALEDSINNFKIEEIKISLKDLSVEDQQKEIEAVFSKIFDDLAGSVIPFIDKFQQTGEGLGETLARVATQVAVADEAALRFGITFGDKLANPEAYAQAADNLSTLAGGVDELASKIVSFTKFADEATQLLIAENGLTKALAEVGLALPDSTIGMWNLMQSLDGTTAAGQEQIATLLNLQSSASDYYNLLESQNERYSSLSSSLRGIIENTYGLSKAASVASLDSALAAAKLGDFSAALAGDFSGAMPTSSDFSSLSDFLFEQAVSANKLEELASLSDSQISIDERQLSELEKINQSIRDSFAANGTGDDAVTATQNTDNLEQIKSDINTLTRTMSRMQEQANDALDRIANGVTTVRIEV